MESDSQNISRELIPSKGTVLPATHGNTDDQTFFLMLSNIYEKWELYIWAKFEQNSENKESAYQIYKVCICHYAYVWKVKRSYGVFWLYLDSVDKVGFALKTLFLILHTCVAHDLRRTFAFFGTKVKFKLGAWTLHYFSTLNPPSFVKRWWYFTHVANDLKRTPFHCWVRDKRSRSNLDI